MTEKLGNPTILHQSYSLYIVYHSLRELISKSSVCPQITVAPYEAFRTFRTSQDVLRVRNKHGEAAFCYQATQTSNNLQDDDRQAKTSQSKKCILTSLNTAYSTQNILLVLVCTLALFNRKYLYWIFLLLCTEL